VTGRPGPVGRVNGATAAPPPRPGPAGSVPPGQSPQDFRGALPPARYAPPPGPAPRTGDGEPARGTNRSPAGPLLVATCVAAAIAVSVVFPIAGTVAALVVLIALRAVGRIAERISRQRSRRGARGSDPVLAVFMFPSSLAGAALRSLLLAPLALALAAVVAVVTITAVPHQPVPAACAYAAGALVAFYGLGPGSGGSRRPMRKFFDSVAFTPVSAGIAFCAAAAVLAGAFVVAASHPPFFWPAGGLPGWLQHFEWLSHLEQRFGSQALRLIGRPSR
jgi:hypothetical protein